MLNDRHNARRLDLGGVENRISCPVTWDRVPHPSRCWRRVRCRCSHSRPFSPTPRSMLILASRSLPDKQVWPTRETSVRKVRTNVAWVAQVSLLRLGFSLQIGVAEHPGHHICYGLRSAFFAYVLSGKLCRVGITIREVQSQFTSRLLTLGRMAVSKPRC